MSHLTQEAAKRVWFINFPEDVEPVTPQDRIAELERENAALARWIVYHSEHTSGDHACAECYPHGHAIKAGFRCAVHIALSIAAIDLGRKEAQP